MTQGAKVSSRLGASMEIVDLDGIDRTASTERTTKTIGTPRRWSSGTICESRAAVANTIPSKYPSINGLNVGSSSPSFSESLINVVW